MEGYRGYPPPKRGFRGRHGLGPRYMYLWECQSQGGTGQAVEWPVRVQGTLRAPADQEISGAGPNKEVPTRMRELNASMHCLQRGGDADLAARQMLYGWAVVRVEYKYPRADPTPTETCPRIEAYRSRSSLTLHVRATASQAAMSNCVPVGRVLVSARSAGSVGSHG